MGRGRLERGSLGKNRGSASHTSPQICAPRRGGWRLSSLDRVPHRPGPRAGGPIIERTCVGGRRGRQARSSGALGCAIAHLRHFQRMTLLLSRGRALTDDFRSPQLPTAEHRTRFVFLGAATCTLPVGTCPVPGSYVSGRLRLTYLACTSLSARTWARPAARRRLCDLPKVLKSAPRPGGGHQGGHVTQHQKTTAHRPCSPSLRLTFTTARFAGAPSSDGLAGVGAVGVSRSRRAPGYHFTCGASPISGTTLG